MPTTEETYTPMPGDTLLNGAVVVAYRQQRNYWIVLAVREVEFEPYITWAVSPVDGEAFWGHYHHDFDKAVEDFKER